MATETVNYKLIKPDTEDFYSVNDFNENMDTLDDAMKMNENKLVRMAGSRRVSLPASAWSSAVPYTQAISIPGVTAEDVPVVGVSIADGTSAADVKNQNKAWGCVDRAVTGDGKITFYCYNKKPAVDFSVNVKGV